MDFNIAGGGIEAVSLPAQYTIGSMQKLVKKNQKSNGGLIYFAQHKRVSWRFIHKPQALFLYRAPSKS